jgi:transposase
MAHPQNDPLRPLTPEERQLLEQTVRSGSERAERVARARVLLAITDGASFTVAGRQAGFRSTYGVAQLVRRFNRHGLLAVVGRHGGGRQEQYGPTAAARILAEFRRPPDREQDGTATWSLVTLQRALRHAPDGFATISTWTILRVLHEAGYSWQNSRTWCQTGVVKRKRKAGVVEVHDPQAPEKRGGSSEPTGGEKSWACPSGVKTRRGLTKRSPTQAPPGSPQENRPANRTSTFGAARPSC